MEIEPWLIGTMLSDIQYKADVIIGSKRHELSSVEYTLTRKIASWGYYFIVKALFGMPYSDTQTGIKLFKREVLEKVLPLTSIDKFAFDVEVLLIAHRLGYKICEHPVVIVNKVKKGKGSTSIIACLKTFKDTLKLWRKYVSHTS